MCKLTAELARIEPSPLVEIETIPVADDSKAVIAVHVPGRTGLFTFDGRPYVRRGPTTSVMPPHQYEGNIFQLLRHAEEFLLNHVSIASEVGTGKMVRTDSPAYPPAATREALANALCHRNYATAGETVGVAMFDDRLEISSPGGLHLGITVADLRRPHASQPWNPLIANVLYRAGVIEQWGTGTTRIAEFCTDNGNPAPEWDERGGTLVLTFRPVSSSSEDTTGEVTGEVEAQVKAQVQAQVQVEAQVGQSFRGRLKSSGATLRQR